MNVEPEADPRIIERMVRAVCAEFGDAPFAMMLEIQSGEQPKQIYFGTNTESPRAARRLLSMGMSALRKAIAEEESRPRRPQQRRRR